MKQNPVLSIIKKELQTYFNSPASYIITIVFTLLWQFLFFRNAFLVNESTLREMFGLLPWLLLVFIPAITMSTIAQEKSSGTLEFVLTRPINNLELLAGKYIASLLFASISLLATLPVAIFFSNFGTFDWGVYVGQLLGAIGMMSVFVALGLFISSLVTSQIAALLLSTVMSFILVITGSDFVTGAVPQVVGLFLEQLSAVTHFNSTTRGVLDVSDAWYYTSVTVVFLGLAYVQLLQRQFGNRIAEYRKYQIGIVLFIVIAILTNVIGSRIPGRLDLTQGRIFTLSQTTKSTIRQLPDVVNITIYRSSELPAQFQPTLREVEDILSDYRRISSDKILVTYKDPSSDTQITQEAASFGIEQVQFNVIGEEELRLKNGYLGMVVSYAGKNEVIPFINNTTDLEYQLTSFIKKLTTTDKKQIGFLSGHGEKILEQEYQLLNTELSKQFDVTTVAIDDENTTIPEDIDVLVIAGPNAELDERTLGGLNTFVEKGKSLLVLHDAIIADTQSVSATVNTSNLDQFIGQFGVTVEKNLVYDLQSNETVSFGGGVFSVVLPYPLWVRAQAAPDSSTLTSRIDQVTLPWTSSLVLDDSKVAGQGFTSELVYTTTNAGGKLVEPFNLSPEQNFPQAELSQLSLIATLAGSTSENGAQRTRMVIVGDSDFLANEYIQNSPQNLSFGIEALSWLAQEDSLAEIQIKQRAQTELVFASESEPALVRYGSMAVTVLVPIIFGVYRLQRRKVLRLARYSSSHK